LSCIKLVHADSGIVRSREAAPMRRFAMKALFTALSLNRAERSGIDWERTIRIVSTAVTVGLVALYVFGKSTSRW
jgi:hypothetical protein